MQDEEKYELGISKTVAILSKLISHKHQPIIEGKISDEVWVTLQ